MSPRAEALLEGGNLLELAEAVRRADVDAEAVVGSCLERLRAGAALGATLHLAEEEALVAARALDARRECGESPGPLAGVPVVVKDSLVTVDAPTTAGSRILTRDGSPGSGWRPPYDATAVRKLRAAGAVVVGKANLDELCMGSSNEQSAFFPARNPWDPHRVPGGSSGGSAVAVAARMAPAALGSDTGGSIRQPAALTGVVGVKPSYGRVSRHGLVAFASSLDCVGPLARDVRSAAALLEVIAGEDPLDPTASPLPVPRLVEACGAEPRGLRVGVPEEYFGDGVDPEVAGLVHAALARLEREGVTLVPLSLPTTALGVPTYYVLAAAEAASNLARLDGMRFGLRVESGGADLAATYGASRDRGFGPEVKRRILLGTFVLSRGYQDRYYARALRARAAISAELRRTFDRVDLIATPTSPFPAFALGQRREDPVSLWLADVFTLPASLAGVPAINVPVGLCQATPARPALPVGLQLIAAPFQEQAMFRAAAAVERAVPLPLPRPPHA